MFRGATKVTLDAKGRMVMPTRYRERLSERGAAGLVITIDRDQCLLIYPLADWEEIERKLMRLPTLNEHARDTPGARRHQSVAPVRYPRARPSRAAPAIAKTRRRSRRRRAHTENDCAGPN
jgi:hypothetical protein